MCVGTSSRWRQRLFYLWTDSNGLQIWLGVEQGWTIFVEYHRRSLPWFYVRAMIYSVYSEPSLTVECKCHRDGPGDLSSLSRFHHRKRGFSQRTKEVKLSFPWNIWLPENVQFVADFPRLSFTSQEIFLAAGNKGVEVFKVIHLLELCPIPGKDWGRAFIAINRHIFCLLSI